MNDKTVTLTTPDKTLTLPVLKCTLGKDVIDVSALSKEGLFTFDPGFMSTASCESALTFIDGGNGILLYRGYPIEQLAEHCNFLEIAHLLLHGELPNPIQKKQFEDEILSDMTVNHALHKCLSSLPQNSHPMALLITLVGALAAEYHSIIDEHDPAHRLLAAKLIISKIPTLTAMCYRHNQGLAFIAPDPKAGYAENFLHQLFAEKDNDNAPNPVLVAAMERIFILHADHEQNASTSTVRLAGSTGTDAFAAIAAGVAALWGAAHGGANEAALTMLREIGSIDHIDAYVAKAKDKDDPFRLMGFGHRVYKNYDPRAKVMRGTCHEVLNELGSHDDPTLKLALGLEKIALEDEYFVDRKLYPNIDFYSGITLNAMGIPNELFTAIFALARTTGWIAHWKEMLDDPQHRIGRPRQRYMGPTERDVKPIDKR